MSITFNTIPSDILVPGWYLEVDNSQAQSGSVAKRGLLIGQQLAAGSASEGDLVQIPTVQAAIAAFGRGSVLHHMAEAWRGEDQAVELWAIPLDDAAGTQATWTVTVTGTATAAGTVYLYVGGRLVTVAVASGDDASAVAAAIDAAVTADSDLPVTSGVVAAVVTLTHRHKGTVGNALDVRVNYLGASGGEELPAGISSIAIAAGVSGATDPAVTAAITAMGDELFDYVVCSLADDTNLNLLKAELDDSTSGRWGPLRMIYGHVFSATKDTQANLTTYGNDAVRNDQHESYWGFYDAPTPPHEWAAALTALLAASTNIHPARPYQHLASRWCKPPAMGSAGRWTYVEANTLLGDGISTTYVNASGKVAIQRVVTGYQKNAQGQPDASYRNANTMFTIMEINRRVVADLQAAFARHMLVDDGVPIPAGTAATSPAGIKARVVATIYALQDELIVENADAFAASFTVERDAVDKDRVNFKMSPDPANQLRVGAGQNAFV